MIKRNEEGLYDTISGLNIKAMNQRFFNEMESTDEEIQEMIDRLEKDGIKYFVDMNETRVLCLWTGVFVKSAGEYYTNWDDVPQHLKVK